MRCIACGEEMLLTAATPDTAMTVQGFEHQTLERPGCGAVERRMVFNRSSSQRSRHHLLLLPAPSSPFSRSEPDRSEPERVASKPESIAPDTAWTRAVEKLRSRQADLPSARVAATKKMEWQVQFNRAWEKLAPQHRGAPPADPAAGGKVTELAWRSAQALRAQLRGVCARARPQSRGATRGVVDTRSHPAV